MKLKPIFDRVIAKRLKDTSEKSHGGIILPRTVSEKPIKAKVLAVGKGILLDSGERGLMEVKVGDTILFHEFSAIEFCDEVDTYLILKQTDILAKEEAK